MIISARKIENKLMHWREMKRQFSVLWRSSREVLVTAQYSSVRWRGFWERMKLKNKVVLQLVRVWQYSRVSPHSAERLYLFFLHPQCPFHTGTYSDAEDLQILGSHSKGLLATEEGWVHPLSNDEQIENFGSFFSRVLYFRLNETRWHRNDTSCPLRAVLDCPQTWNSLECENSAEGCVINCPCNPQVRFSVKLQILLKLSTCRNSTLCSIFHYYATLWRSLCYEYP